MLIYFRRKTCLFTLICSVIIIWMCVQFGFMRAWLEEALRQSSVNCPTIIHLEASQELIYYKQQFTRLKRYVAANLPGNTSQQYLEEFHPALPVVYAVTPTYSRPAQKAELVRLSQTFLLVRNFHWVVVEDASDKTELVAKLLKRSGLVYTHLNIATPSEYKLGSSDPNWLKPRGVQQRNLAISWFRQTFSPSNANGVIYFADDDNTYDMEIFEQMRNTKRVSVWPIGLVGGLLVEKPIVENGKVVSWFTAWKPNRPFPIDMAGFAVNLKILLERPTAMFNLSAPRGYQESSLLQNLVTLSLLEPKADNCTQVLVWHTRSEKAKLKAEVALRRQGMQSNLGIEV